MFFRSFENAFVRGAWTWALPRLNELPVSRWDDAIRHAGSIDFDAVEKVALLVGVVGTTYLLRIDSATVGLTAIAAVFLAQLIDAALLLTMFLVPFFLRRARRGLDAFLAEERRKQVPPRDEASN